MLRFYGFFILRECKGHTLKSIQNQSSTTTTNSFIGGGGIRTVPGLFPLWFLNTISKEMVSRELRILPRLFYLLFLINNNKEIAPELVLTILEVSERLPLSILQESSEGVPEGGPEQKLPARTYVQTYA